MIDYTTGLDVQPGTTGELLVRGAANMRGYLGNPQATAATVDADGFVHTGDIVVADDAGGFRVVDRLKESSSTKGIRWPRWYSRRSCSRIRRSPRRP